MLVNAAGFGTCGNFFETDFAMQKKMIEVHVMAAVTLCRAALPGMIARNSGGIINIASINAFTRFPETAIYSATKMFLVAFTECIQAELDKVGAKNVAVQALCPGQTHTAFTETKEMRGFDPSRVPSFMWTTPDALVELSLARLARGSGTYIPRLRNKLFCMVFGSRLIDRILVFLRKYGVLEKVLAIFRKPPAARTPS